MNSPQPTHRYLANCITRSVLLLTIALGSGSPAISQTPEAPRNVRILSLPDGNSHDFYGTGFPLAENPISEGGNWINGKTVGLDWNNVQTIPGRAYGAVIVSSYNDDIAVLNTTFAADQYAQGTVYRAAGYAPSGSHEIELLLRFKITAHNARGYEVLWGGGGQTNGEIAIIRWNGPLGDYTSLASTTIAPAVDGDVLRVEIIGSVIKVYRNGSLVLTGPSNSTWTDGQPGVGFWPTDRGGVTSSSYGWKTFEAGNR